jgi:[ribosomal protein S18]-alanine N-acetyltransferase
MEITMAIEIEIRRMTEDDLDEVIAIEMEAFTDPWSKPSFKYDLTGDYAYPIVASFEGEIAGYASLYMAADEMMIGNFAVAPKFQKLGIGSQIMEYCIELAISRHITQIALEVRESNQAARNLYLKYGFKITGRRKLYYRNPTEDAIMMIRGIN